MKANRIRIPFLIAMTWLVMSSIQPTKATAQKSALTKDVEQLVHDAARELQSHEAPFVKVGRLTEAGDYPKIVERLKKFGKDAIPVLYQLTKSKELSRFERRLAWILAQRLQNPKQFKVVEQLLIPFPRIGRWFRRSSPPRAIFAPIPNEMLHSQALAILQKYDKLFAELRKSNPEKYEHCYGFREAERKYGKKFREFLKANAGNVNERSLQKYDKANPKIGTLNPKPIPDEWRNLSSNLRKEWHREFSLPNFPREISQGIDPSYLAALEEASVRLLPYELKSQFARFVRQLGDPASAPIHVEVLRQSIVQSERKRVSGWTRAIGAAQQEATFAIKNLPMNRSLPALGDMLLNISDPEEKKIVSQFIGGDLAYSVFGSKKNFDAISEAMDRYYKSLDRKK